MIASNDNIEVANQKLKILFVDDEPLVLQSIKRALRNENYQILTATSAKEGMDQLIKHSAHLVVSDFLMPAVNGSEFLSYVKQFFPNTIRVILTGCMKIPSFKSDIDTSDASFIMAKPWRNDQLREKIREALDFYFVKKSLRTMNK